MDLGLAFTSQVSAQSQVSQKSVASTGSHSASVDLAQPQSRQVSGCQEDGDLGGFVNDILVNDLIVRQGMETAVADCTFVVTIADPRVTDCPLIAVSQEFENLTGFRRKEIIGVNCRFLNQGCDMDPVDLMKLRESSKTGAPYTAVVPNRKKSGEMFLNLLDVRGLTVARDKTTGEDIWFLIGIQADVTDLAETEVPADHMQMLHTIADEIRTAITQELAKMAVQGSYGAVDRLGCTGSADWELLEVPLWRPRSNLAEALTPEPPRPSNGVTSSTDATSSKGPQADRRAVGRDLDAPEAPLATTVGGPGIVRAVVWSAGAAALLLLVGSIVRSRRRQ